MKKPSLNDLKNAGADRVKVIAWLDHIGELDNACREEVLAHCSNDTSARAYYVQRHREDCEK